MMGRRAGGYITLYLALTLGVMLSLAFTCIEGVRMQTIRMETEGVMDIGLYSVFAEYNRQLLEQYDLFYIDTTYGEGSPDIGRTKEHLHYYLNENFEKARGTALSFVDLTAISCDNVSLTAYVRASDEGGQSLSRQIAEYMKSKTGISVAEDTATWLGLIQTGGYDSWDIEEEWSRVSEEINTRVEERKQQLLEEDPEREIDISVDNPANYAWGTRGSGILSLALAKGSTVSAVEIHPEYYFSHRQPLTGLGSVEREEGFLEQAVDRLLLQEYLFEKCGYYGQSLDKGILSYQIEYILKGQGRDADNLREVLEDILHIREAANFAYLLSDSGKQAQADAVATAVSAVTFLPEIKELVKYSILLAWTYAESVKDIRILLDGHKVPMMKDSGSWNTPLTQLINFTSYLGSYSPSGSGLSYRDYLGVFLYVKGEGELLSGFMDVCEMDIRLTTGNEYFQMDGCIEALQASANVSSGFGYSYEITRSYYY